MRMLNSLEFKYNMTQKKIDFYYQYKNIYNYMYNLLWPQNIYSNLLKTPTMGMCS